MPLPSSACQSARNSAYRYDSAIKRVVIVGADDDAWGAAKAVRQLHPACDIYVIGEGDPLAYLQYNPIQRTGTRKNQRDLQTVLVAQPPMGKINLPAIRWMNVGATRIVADSRKIRLTDGSEVNYERLILSATGQGCTETIYALARSGGLRINRGVLIDSWMRTSDPFVFAMGELTELDERSAAFSLSTISQPEVAAASAVVGPGVSLVCHFALSPQAEFYIH